MHAPVRIHEKCKKKELALEKAKILLNAEVNEPLRDANSEESRSLTHWIGWKGSEKGI